MTYWFVFGQPRRAHRLVSETLTEVVAACGVRRNNNGSVRWTQDPKTATCAKCRVPTHAR